MHIDGFSCKQSTPAISNGKEIYTGQTIEIYKTDHTDYIQWIYFPYVTNIMEKI